MESDRANEIPVLVLAAGASKRMQGKDKLVQTVGDVPLLRRQVLRARSVSDTVLVALPPAPHPRYACLDKCDVSVVVVPDAELGMGHSLRAGIAALPPDASHVMIMLPDMPDITAEDIAAVARGPVDQPDATIWRGATEDGTPGHPIVFEQRHFADLRELTGDRGGAPVLSRYPEQVALVLLPENNAVLDLDTPDAWHAWRQNQKAGDP